MLNPPGRSVYVDETCGDALLYWLNVWDLRPTSAAAGAASRRGNADIRAAAHPHRGSQPVPQCLLAVEFSGYCGNVPRVEVSEPTTAGRSVWLWKWRFWFTDSMQMEAIPLHTLPRPVRPCSPNLVSPFSPANAAQPHPAAAVQPSAQANASTASEAMTAAGAPVTAGDPGPPVLGEQGPYQQTLATIGGPPRVSFLDSAQAPAPSSPSVAAHPTHAEASLRRCSTSSAPAPASCSTLPTSIGSYPAVATSLQSQPGCSGSAGCSTSASSSSTNTRPITGAMLPSSSSAPQRTRCLPLAEDAFASHSAPATPPSTAPIHHCITAAAPAAAMHSSVSASAGLILPLHTPEPADQGGAGGVAAGDDESAGLQVEGDVGLPTWVASVRPVPGGLVTTSDVQRTVLQPLPGTFKRHQSCIGCEVPSLSEQDYSNWFCRGAHVLAVLPRPDGTGGARVHLVGKDGRLAVWHCAENQLTPLPASGVPPGVLGVHPAYGPCAQGLRHESNARWMVNLVGGKLQALDFCPSLRPCRPVGGIASNYGL